MTDMETIEQRLSAVERTLTDGTDEFESLAAASDLDERMTTIEQRLDDIEDRLTELDASTQALRGYVGNVRSVNQEVERRAETALAKVERLEAAREPTSTDDETGRQQDTETATQRPRDNHRAHTCDACGQVADESGQAARQSQQDEQTANDEQTPTAWARAVGTDQRETTDTPPRADGGQRQGRQGRHEPQARGRATDRPRTSGEDGEDTGLLAGLRDVL